MLSEKRQQVIKQLEAVAHLAKALAGVSTDLAKMYADPTCKVDELVDQTGNRSARHMELLGEIMNGTDALWEDAAFTNGGPLVKIELVWAPNEAAKLQQELQKPPSE